MGDIVITEVQDVGSRDHPNANILGRPVVTVRDTGTTTAPVLVQSHSDTRYLSVASVAGAHRVTVNAPNASEADTNYFYVGEGSRIEIAINPNANYAYRADA